MARKIKLTDARIGKLRAGDVEYTVWDTRISGFGVRVRPTGHKSYVYHRYTEGQSRRFTLAQVALESVDEARRDCMEVWNRMQSGKRAEGADDAQAPLFRDFVAGSWRAACYEPCKPSTKTSKDWALNNQLLPVFGAMPLDRIDRTGVIRWFGGYSVTAPGGANSALLVFRQIMNHAISRGHIEINPTRGVKRNPRPKLTRFLSREEIGRLHEVLDGYEPRRPSCKAQADIIRLLLLTGCRSGEMLKLRWREVEDDTLELEDSKTGPRQVLLSPEARAIIERQPQVGKFHGCFPHQVNPARARVGSQPVEEGAEAGRYRGCAPSRPQAHVRQPSGDAGYSAAGGGASSRPRPGANDAALCARQRPGRRGRRRAHRRGDGGDHAQIARSAGDHAMKVAVCSR